MSVVPSLVFDRLAGKIAIVTGAGTAGEGFGIGRAIAVRFAGEGAKVCLLDRDGDAAKATLEIIQEMGGEAFVVTADLVDEADCSSATAQCAARFGGIDILVNSVGIAEAPRPVDQLDLTTWQNVFDVNLRSAIQMAKFAIPKMRARGGGAIVNIASIAGLVSYGSLAYGPSKAALIQLTRELAVLHGRDGIRVNVLAPGHVYTPMVAGHLSEEMREARRRAGPLGIEGDAWDVAAAALFLASNDARFITGACLPVDGGITIVGSVEAARWIADLNSRPSEC